MEKLRELTVKDIQNLQLSALVHLSQYCQTHSIPFLLSNGTLLGAIKYHGFIPWDDDVDVLIPRKAYDRLIGEYRDCARYKLFSPERTPAFGYPFAKLCDMSTEKTERNLNNGVSLGVEVDIFPLDAWAPTLEEAKKQVFRNKKLTKQLGYVKTKQFVPSNRHGFIGRCLRKYGHRLYKLTHSSRKFCEKMMEEALRYRNLENPTYLGCVIWPVYGLSEILPAEVFSTAVEVVFEGKKYLAPAGFEYYLRSLYGDYNQDPPKEKQVSHHSFDAYWRNSE